MENQLIEVRREGNIEILTINRPEALNALNSALLKELDQTFDRLENDTEVRVVILTGAGKSFVAGADISEMKDLDSFAARTFSLLGAQVFRKIEMLNKVVIAAVNGFALGGGCELMMAADIRLASTKAKMGQPEVGLGIPPGFSGTQRLPRLVGLGKAKELIYTAKIISAEEAEKIGLVNQVIEPDALLETAMEMAKAICAQSPAAVFVSKVAINRGYEMNIDAGIELENDLFALCFSGAEQKEGMSAFLEKRKADFINITNK